MCVCVHAQVACSGLYRDINNHPVSQAASHVTMSCDVYVSLCLQVDCEIDVDHPENVTADRQTLYCVPIPGETPWVKAVSYLESTRANIISGH